MTSKKEQIVQKHLKKSSDVVNQKLKETIGGPKTADQAYLPFGFLDHLTVYAEKKDKKISDIIASQEFRKHVEQEAEKLSIPISAIQFKNAIVHPYGSDQSNLSLQKLWNNAQKLKTVPYVILTLDEHGQREKLCEKLKKCQEDLVKYDEEKIKQFEKSLEMPIQKEKSPDLLELHENDDTQISQQQVEPSGDVETSLETSDPISDLSAELNQRFDNQNVVINQLQKSIEDLTQDNLNQRGKIKVLERKVDYLMGHTEPARKLVLKELYQLYITKIERKCPMSNRESFQDYIQRLCSSNPGQEDIIENLYKQFQIVSGNFSYTIDKNKFKKTITVLDQNEREFPKAVWSLVFGEDFKDDFE